VTTQKPYLNRAYAVLAWLLAVLAVLHMATTFRFTSASASTKVWFFSAGLAMAQTAAFNLLHRKYGRSVPALGWVTRGSNALLLAVSVAGGLATGASVGELAVVLGVLVAILVLSFTDSACQPH
jgi:hypothetical protein